VIILDSKKFDMGWASPGGLRNWGADGSAPKSSAAPDNSGRWKLSWLLAARILVATPASGDPKRIGRTCGKTVSAMRSVIGCGG